MKRWLILAALVIGISASATIVQYLPQGNSSTDVVAFPAPPKASGPVPKVVVEGDPVYEFGSLAQHTEITRDWVISNKGKGDLRLFNPSTSCSCTVMNFREGNTDRKDKEITVKPQESTTIHLSFNTKEFSGEYHQHATISTTDPEQPSIQLSAHGEVHPALVFMPPEKTIAFMSMSNDTDHRARLAIWSPDRPGFKITKAYSSKPDKIEVTSAPLSDEDRKQLKVKEGGYQVVVAVKRGMALGPFRDEVVIETDHPKAPMARMIVHGKIVGPVMVVPEHLKLTSISAKTGGKGSVTLVVSGKRATKFEVVKKPEQLEAAVEPTDTEGKYRLTIGVPAGATPGEIEGLVVLKSDHPLAETVKVPITVYVRQ